MPDVKTDIKCTLNKFSEPLRANLLFRFFTVLVVNYAAITNGWIPEKTSHLPKTSYS